MPITTVRARDTKPTGRAARLSVTALLGCALALTAACSPQTPEPPQVPDPVTVTPTIEPSRTVPPEPVVPVVWPLTGVEAAEVANRPAVAVKIENTSSARPQSGLEDADVVWETIVEFEVSRFVAVYHSAMPAEVGPIRSVRPMDPLIVAPLKGLLVFSGGQPGILAEVRNSPAQAISHDGGAAGLYRVSHRSAPHNVYGSLDTFVQQADADHAAAPAEQFGFARSAELATAVTRGTPANLLDFRLSGQSRPSWNWDAASGRYLRNESGTPATSADGDRISAVNVVSVTADHPPTGYGAQGGAAVPTYNLTGSGEAAVATGGKIVPARWSKPDPNGPLTLVDEAGAPVLLAPGNTWVELVPAGKGSLTIG